MTILHQFFRLNSSVFLLDLGELPSTALLGSLSNLPTRVGSSSFFEMCLGFPEGPS